MPSFEIDRAHPLAIGLRSLWIPAQDAGEDLLRNLAGGSAAGVVDTLPFPTNVGERPTWAVGQAGEALDFDGVNDYLARTTNLPWLPATEGGDLTVAIYGEIFAYPTSSTVEMWSSQYAPGTVDRVIATLGLRASSGTVRWRVCLNEAGGSSADCTIAWPPLRTPFLVIATTRGETDHEMAVFAPGLGVPSFVTDITSRQPIASFNPTSEVIGNEIYAGATDAAFNGRIYGAWVWNRGLSNPDMTGFLLDPFGMLRAKRVSGGIGALVAVDGGALGQTVTETWSLTPGTAGAGGLAGGALFTERWSLLPGVATAPGSTVAPGATVTETVSLIPGQARAASSAGAALVTEAWSLSAVGVAAGTATAAAGALLTEIWSLIPAASPAFRALPVPIIGGGSFGPGGIGAGVPAETRRKVRLAAGRAQAEAEGTEFWPDPEDLSPEELEEWAAKAEAAGVPVLPGESEAAFAARIQAEVEQFMAQQEAANNEALFLLMVS